MAGDAHQHQSRRSVTTAGGIRGIILSIKDDVIVIRVAPDNIKLEVARAPLPPSPRRTVLRAPSGAWKVARNELPQSNLKSGCRQLKTGFTFFD